MSDHKMCALTFVGGAIILGAALVIPGEHIAVSFIGGMLMGSAAMAYFLSVHRS